MDIFIIKKSAFAFRGVNSYDLEILGKSILERMEETLCATVLNEGELPKGGGERLYLYPAFPFVTLSQARAFCKDRAQSFAFEGGFYTRDGSGLGELDVLSSFGALGISVFNLNDFIFAQEHAARLRNEGLRQNGVFVEDGAQIDEGATVGKGTYLSKNTVVRGSVSIGENCTVLGECQLIECTVGSGTEINCAQLIECSVGKNCKIGPYAYLRPFSEVGNGCRIGDYVELKNATVGDGTKIAHHAYVGDATVGKGVNVGCGVVFANYNGRQKSRSIVGDRAFIGCNCNLIAPVQVGAGAYVAAGTTVADHLKDGDFCIGRCRGYVKEGGAQKYMK